MYCGREILRGTHIMLDRKQKFNGQNFKSWKQKMLAIFEYRCLDKLVLGKEVWSQTDVDAQANMMQRIKRL
jgi:hypothetical protein